MKHISVLYDKCIEALAIKPDGTYIDATMGGAGHSEGICKKLSKDGHFIGIDTDTSVFEKAEQRLKDYKCKKTFIHDNFNNYGEIVKSNAIKKVDGILIDLGVSSFQIDDAARGFSFKQNGPLDMRMDKTKSLSAKEIVNTYSPDKLRSIISRFGEEKYASSIARNIVRTREDKIIETTEELVEIIRKSVPAKYARAGHPAKKTFQAIRIETNTELDNLHSTLSDMIDSLNKNGRLAVISFHSLEDRIVKTVMNEYAQGCTCPKEFPVCICGNEPKVKILTRKPIVPTDEEIEANPRSRSAKLRIAKKL